MVTGAAGYIGSVVVRKFLDAGLRVIGVDSLEFGTHGVDELVKHENFQLINADIRAPEHWLAAVNASDAILHLAAVVGDHACAAQPDLATSINVDASSRLLEAAISSPRTQRFIFASTCSNYGQHRGSAYCDENSELRPVSHYARTKVTMERRVLEVATASGFSASCLRFATAFGLSPRMRFDLTVNDFTRELAEGRHLEIFGSQFWRPYCHTQDIARACLAHLKAAPHLSANKAFNVGATKNNFTKGQLARILRSYIPAASIDFIEKGKDLRSYKVNCDLFADTFDYQTKYTINDGLVEIIEALEAASFSGIPESLLNNSMAS